jgi:hypothetical protein
MKNLFLLLLILFSGYNLKAQVAERISMDWISYIDPELLNTQGYLTFQTVNGEVWIGELNPLTGLFKNDNGFDMKLNSNAAPTLETFNGPEFGYNSKDWTVVYTVKVDGINQIWESRISNEEIISRQVTFGDISRQSVLATKNINSETTRIAYSIGGFRGLMAWKDLNDIDKEFIIDSVDRGIRWIDGSNSLAYIKQTGVNKGEIAIYDTDNRSEEIVSSDGRTKANPYGWFAPEYEDELLVTVLLDNDTKIGIYKRNDTGNWEIIREIEVPENSEYEHFGSPEPFTIAGKSYISCVIKEEERAYSNSEIWMFSLDHGNNTDRNIRIDDGLGTIIRSDPETFIGENEVFIYYNVINQEGIFEVYRARTGLETLNSSDIEHHMVRPAVTSPDIAGLQEPHHIIWNSDINKLNKLLVYFPGTGARPYDYLKFCKTAANMGFHAISLSYENQLAVNYHACGKSTDTTCHRRARHEIWFGEDTHEIIEVDFNNSIINILQYLLVYLIENHPDENWSQYYEDGNINWEKITVAGHSQGGGHAGFAAKNFRVDKSIMIAASDWVNGQTADWIRQPGPTEKEKYYGFIHSQDLPAAAIIMPTWRDYGILDFGQPVNVDVTEPPYNNVHGLMTELPVPDSIRPHNYVIVDCFTPNADNYTDYLYSAVWKYLLEPKTGTGIKEEQVENYFSIYPNPASDVIEISLSKGLQPLVQANDALKIYNTFGESEIKYEFQITNYENLRIDISHLPAGLYIIQIGNYSEKFVVVR